MKHRTLATFFIALTLFSTPLQASVLPDQEVVYPITGGILWHGLQWVGLPDSRIEALKNLLADHADIHAHAPYGITLLGGVLLGVIIKSSGSYFFGKSPETNEQTHWFWKTINRVVKGGGQGIARGSLFATACYLVLTGPSPIPYHGILGPEFQSLSAAAVVGGMSAMAMSMIRTASEYPMDVLIYAISKGPVAAVWTRSTKIKEGMLYQVARSIFIVGVGSGVGYVVYQTLQSSQP